MPKNAEKFTCQTCDFICSKQSNFNKHVATPKHISQCQGYKSDIVCDCGKKYNYPSGLWRHKKKCNYIKPVKDEKNNDMVEHLIKETADFKTIMLELVKSNQDLQAQMLSVCKNNNNTNTIINSNSHNKTFNLQFFLNETCKDAMNIMDFVDSFTLQLSDLESVSQQGYVDGISTIIVKKLNEMDIHKRPIHCSDAKREIMYVKDQNKWEKEEPGYSKLRKAIKYISKKNSDLLGQWSEAHPASKNITTQTNTEYMQMIVQAMGGRGEIGENENKIIKKIARTVLIEKE